MNRTVQLHSTKQLTPERDRIKAGVKPFKLTVLFDYVEWSESHPYGSTVAHESRAEVQNEEFFMDGVEIPVEELKPHLAEHFPEVDFEELIESMTKKAVDEFHKS